MEEYRGGFFADSTDALYYQEETLSSLNELLALGVNETALDAVATEVETASNVSATLAHYQAQQTVRAHEDELNDFQYTQAVVALDNARTERDWGDDSQSSTTAIWHYRAAWEHAQIALDTVEEAVDPSLSLDHGPAIETNGTYETTVYISLSDIRPHRYETANVTFENGETRTINLTGGQVANSRARATLDLDLGEELTNRTVTVSATSQREPFLGVCFTIGNCERTVEETLEISIDENDIIPDRPAPDEEVEVDVEDNETGAVVEVEGPGLIDDDISIEDKTPKNDTAFHASPVVRVENSSEITEATVRLPVETDSETTQENLSMYTWDPTRANGSGWTEVGGEYNPETGMVSADVEHFSFFAVFDSAEWEDALTETITLEDRHVKGSLNNSDGGGTARADFMLTIDYSGSMRPDKLPFAKEAAGAFIDGMYENDRVGIASFAGANSGSVSVPLTTNKERAKQYLGVTSSSQNVTLDPLATDLTSGIQASIDELANRGRENRSQVMILLADGGASASSYDPVEAARDAREQGITINTVGVTDSVDKDLLREIANVSGGGYYFAEDPEDLPDVFDRVQNDRIELVDSDNDGLPDAVEEANPPIPQFVSEADLGSREQRRINTEPGTPDTDNDGILDGESVTVESQVITEDGERVLQTRVRWAGDHPARADTDEDGLDDGQERNGWPTIWYTAERDDSVGYQEALRSSEDPDLEALREEYFESVEVSSNPFVADTDGDGLSDSTELNLETNPEAGDTTGDGIPDELAAEENLNPTLFDMQPPEITVTYWEWDKPPLQFKADYTVHAMFEDPGGLGQTQIVKDGSVEREHPLSSDWDSIESEFTSGILEGIADSLKGTEVSVRASDQYGSTASTTAIERRNLPAIASEELAERGIAGNTLAQYLALHSGFLTGAGESAAAVRELLNNPVEYVQAMTRILEVIGQLDQIPAAIDEQQDRNNPYNEDEEPENYDTYRQNWFKGYMSFMVVQMLSPAGQAANIIKSTSRFQSFVRRLDSSRLSRAVSTARTIRDAEQRAVAVAKFRVKETLITAKDLTQVGAGRLIDGAQTAGAALRRGALSEELDTRTLRILSEGTDEIDESYRQAVFRGGDGAVRTRDINRGVRKIDELEGANAQRAKQLVIETDGQALRLISELDDSAVRQLTEIEGPEASTFRQSLVRQYADGAVDASAVQQTVQKVKDLDGDAQTRAMRLVEETTDGNGIQVIDGLNENNLGTLLSTCTGTAVSSSSQADSSSGSDVVTTASRCPGYTLLKNIADPDMPDSNLNLLLEPLEENQIQQLALGLAGKESPGSFLDEMDPDTMRQIADTETPAGQNAFEVSYDIFADGYSKNAVRRLADEGLTTRQTQQTLARLEEYRNNYEVSDSDDIAEIYGEVKLESELGDEYEVVSQVDIDYADTSLNQEVDQIIIEDGIVVGAGQTKNPRSSNVDGALEDAEKQHNDLKRYLQQHEVEEISRAGGGGNFDPEISSETINDEQLYTIGPTSDFDIKTLRKDRMEIIYQVFSSRFLE